MASRKSAALFALLFFLGSLYILKLQEPEKMEFFNLGPLNPNPSWHGSSENHTDSHMRGNVHGLNHHQRSSSSQRGHLPPMSKEFKQKSNFAVYFVFPLIHLTLVLTGSLLVLKVWLWIFGTLISVFVLLFIYSLLLDPSYLNLSLPFAIVYVVSSMFSYFTAKNMPDATVSFTKKTSGRVTEQESDEP